jgi:hypothetical protein
MFIPRVILAVSLSFVTLIIAFLLDNFFVLFPYHLQFILEIPTIIIIIDSIRLYFLENAYYFNLSEADINGCFFFVAPMVSIGASSLFSELRRFLPTIRFVKA